MNVVGLRPFPRKGKQETGVETHCFCFFKIIYSSLEGGSILIRSCVHWEPVSVWVSEGKAHCAIRKQPAWWKHGGPGEEEHSQEEGLSPLTLGLVLAECYSG